MNPPFQKCQAFPRRVPRSARAPNAASAPLPPPSMCASSRMIDLACAENCRGFRRSQHGTRSARRRRRTDQVARFGSPRISSTEYPLINTLRPVFCISINSPGNLGYRCHPKKCPTKVRCHATYSSRRSARKLPIPHSPSFHEQPAIEVDVVLRGESIPNGRIIGEL